MHERPPLEVYGTRGAWIERASPLTERFGARHATSREAASPTSVIAATMTSQAHEIEAVAAEQRPQRPALIAVTNALDRGGMSANLARPNRLGSERGDSSSPCDVIAASSRRHGADNDAMNSRTKATRSSIEA